MLVWNVREALHQAGFHLVGGADPHLPGLLVTQTPDEVVISWRSAGFFPAGQERSARTRAMVTAAVSGVLTGLGFTLRELPDGADLVVLTDAQQRDKRPARSAVPPGGGAR